MAAFLFRGVRASYQTWGQGHPILLLHSGGSSSAQWAKVAEQLSADHKMIAPDFLGFGATEPWPEPGGLTHELQADLVAEVMRSEGSAALDIVGHSYGGATAIRLLVGRPQLVRSLMLIEPIVSWLLKDANDPLYEESVGVARAFIASVNAGRSEFRRSAMEFPRNFFCIVCNRLGLTATFRHQLDVRFPSPTLASAFSPADSWQWQVAEVRLARARPCD
jgi:pimeloyl-ACP methyl ester carboxylesterase